MAHNLPNVHWLFGSVFVFLPHGILRFREFLPPWGITRPHIAAHSEAIQSGVGQIGPACLLFVIFGEIIMRNYYKVFIRERFIGVETGGLGTYVEIKITESHGKGVSYGN